jgi:DNA polymerase-1
VPPHGDDPFQVWSQVFEGMPAGASVERMYLVDAHALIFQVFHAIPEMSSPLGLPTNALFGFTKDLLTLRLEKRTDYLVCAFDRPGPVFRNELYPDYKAHRPPMPDDLLPQLPQIHRLLEAMRIPVLSWEGYEADDVIATVATAAARNGMEVFICTTDKDCRQLIDDRVCLYNLRKRQVFDRAALLQDWGITPEQVVDLQALVGDSVDNVPGVPGIGVKTAAKLLQEYHSLDNILANVDSIPGAKKQKSLREAGERVALSRRLVRLAQDVPLAMDWEAWRLQQCDAPRLLALFKEWGFHRFADQVRAATMVPVSVAAEAAPETRLEIASSQAELFPFGANLSPDGEAPPGGADHDLPSPGQWQATYHLVDTQEKLQAFLQELRLQRAIACDLETTGLQPLEAEIVGYAFCWRPGEAWYLPVRAPADNAQLDPAETLAQLRPVLEDSRVSKVNQNIKYDLLVLRQQGIRVAGVAGDPMVADYLLHAGERNHSMEVLARQYLNHNVIPITDLIGKKGKKQLRMDQVPTARVAEYSSEDADVAWRLCETLEGQLEKENLKRPPDRKPPKSAKPSKVSQKRAISLYDDLEIPLIEVLAELEFNGIRLDIPFLTRLGEDMARQLENIEQEIYGLAGHSFNIASLKQLRQVLFDELKLPVQRRTGITGEPSTDQETLERLATLGHLLPAKLVEQRQIAKLKGTYVDALPALVNPATSRIHASFNQTVAATGRLSSSDPNLQNIPIRTEQGGQIRQAFLPEPGWVLLTADYSQVELRLLAHFCGDEGLRQTFAADQDVHASVAAQVFGVTEADVTREMRRVAKMVNFGVIYGISAHGLATRLGMAREQAGQFIDAYFARYPLVEKYQQDLLAKCLRDGYVSTILGRRRAITGIRPNSTYQQRNQPEREAINMEIQGSAADLIKLAMLNIHRRLDREQQRARMLLQIHDELVFEVAPEELPEVARLVDAEMTGALDLKVKLKVDLATGPNWLNVTDYRL